MEKLAKSLRIEGISRSQVSEMTRGLREPVGEFRNRPLTACNCPVLRADALYENVRYGDRVVSMAILLIFGVNKEIRRRTRVVGYQIMLKRGIASLTEQSGSITWMLIDSKVANMI